MHAILSGYNIDDENRRLELRQEKRRELASIQVHQERITELRAIGRSIDDDSDKAADKHAEKCEPLQTELTSIDGGRIAAIVERIKPKETGERRAALLKQLSDFNVELELSVEANTKTKKKIEQEIGELVSQCTRFAAIENDLVRLGTPEQLDRQWLLGQKLQAALSWAKHCRERVETVASYLSAADRYNAASVADLDRRERQWKLALDDAQADAARLQQQQAELRQAMLDA
jgi:hypothetical protein